jgi:hypothetical protein
LNVNGGGSSKKLSPGEVHVLISDACDGRRPTDAFLPTSSALVEYFFKGHDSAMVAPPTHDLSSTVLPLAGQRVDTSAGSSHTCMLESPDTVTRLAATGARARPVIASP